jgi:hypothetical protein
MTIEAMKQALEALENVTKDYVERRQYKHNKAIDALRAAIETYEKQEPMPDALIASYEKGFKDGAAQRQWVGLTGDEREQIYQEHYPDSLATTITAVEAKLKEKNT